jgi:hypothetical protein
MKSQNILDTFEHTAGGAAPLSRWKCGAGDGDRTRDIQLGKFPIHVGTSGSICEITEKTAFPACARKRRKRRKER